MTENVQVASFNQIAVHYDETHGGSTRGRSVADLIDHLLPDPGPILEIGVGTGVIAAGLHERGREAFGIDLSLDMIEYANERIPGRLALADAHRMPIRSAMLAGCYAFGVLYLLDIGHTFAETRRVLRPGGRFIVSVASTEPTSDTGGVLVTLRQNVLPTYRRDDVEECVTPIAQAHGLRLVRRILYTRPNENCSPAQTMQWIRKRAFSWMQQCADIAWYPAAERAIHDLQEMPDQHTPRPYQPYPVLVYQSAGS